jgi:hypothetical protein
LAEKAAAQTPRNILQVRVLPEAYNALGRFYESGRDPKAAAAWYAKASAVWQEWRKRGGLMNPRAVRTEREAVEGMARCGRSETPIVGR